MNRHIGLLAIAILAVGAVVGAPVAAAASTCTWHVSKVPTPAGYDERHTEVRGTDSHGNYVGIVLSTTSDAFRVVLWTDGQPRFVDLFDDFTYPQVADENSAGDVLVSGHQNSTGDTGAFRYASGTDTLTHLPSPAGYETDYAVAINEHNDVLAVGHSVKDGHAVSLLWSSLAVGPVVIDSPYGQGIDLDDDGTVLLYDGHSNPAHLWRHGQTTALPGNAPLLFDGMRAGKVIGTQIQTWPESQSLLWNDRSVAPRPLDQGGLAQAINVHGLVAGKRDTLVGPAAVWQDTTYLGDLPLPDGARSVPDISLIGDDDTIFGRASDYGPMKWICTSTGPAA
jgi:hypothetical protein